MKVLRKVSFYLIILISISLTSSCKRVHNYFLLKQFYNKQMNFSGDYWRVTGDTAVQGNPIQALGPINLISYLDEHLCAPCLSNYLNAGLRYTYAFESDSLKYICIAYPREMSDLQEAINGLSEKEVTIFYDVNNVFFENNKLDRLMPDVPKSFLVDRYGKIILVGDPITSEPLYKLYRKNIRMQLEEMSKQ